MPRVTASDRQLHEAVGEQIRRARRQRGMSQEQLAEALSVSAVGCSRSRG